MNEEQFKSEVDKRWRGRRTSEGRVFAGLFLLLIGVLLLLHKSGSVIFPAWFFGWQGIVIAIGLFMGIRHGFRGGVWFILLIVGGLGILGDSSGWDLRQYIGPIVIMAIGLMFILRPGRRRWHRHHYHHHRFPGPDRDGPSGPDSDKPGPDTYKPGPAGETRFGGTYDSRGDSRDFLDVTAVFGGVKKNILSKSFKGGDIVSFMGGSEIDLTQADFTGTIRMDVTNIFGGTKMVIPPTWDVQNDITAVFGGVDDKRQVSGIQANPEKVLVLDGTCLFGGIEIRSY